MSFDMDFLISILFFTVLGLCVGSFLNVVIYRLPIMVSDSSSTKTVNGNEVISFKCRFNLCFPSSFCPNCFHPLKLRYNIPLVGWLFLRGIAQCCQKRINPRYVIVELLTLFLTLSSVFFIKDSYLVFYGLLFIWAVIALSFIDIEHYILPDCITLPLLWCGIFFNINNAFSPLSFSVLGAIAGYMFLWLPYWIFKLFKNIDGMGYGDFKLMAALGAWFGIIAIPFLVLLSSCLGVMAYIIINYLLKKKLKYIAFGPCIALAGVVYLFLGQYINFLFY
ncbi:prepilin peptidase [Yersinia artesiana]|uniref:prepilin peptidase n=1 Tax=Yersinia artesiana TaxID=2890315 RepID=UPI001581D859|nr:A24 family peptidase [Yersinia artesiana]